MIARTFAILAKEILEFTINDNIYTCTEQRHQEQNASLEQGTERQMSSVQNESSVNRGFFFLVPLDRFDEVCISELQSRKLFFDHSQQVTYLTNQTHSFSQLCTCDIRNMCQDILVRTDQNVMFRFTFCFNRSQNRVRELLEVNQLSYQCWFFIQCQRFVHPSMSQLADNR